MAEIALLRGGAPDGVDPTEARRAARDILSRPEYAEPEPSVLERALDWLFERLGSFFGALTGGGPGSVIGWLVVSGLVLGATWLLARSLRVPAVTGGSGRAQIRYGTETRRDPDEWLREAARLEAAGDLRGALRCRYQALLATAVARGVVDDVPGRTAGDHRRLLSRALPAVTAEIDELTDAFERAWYGGAAVDQEALRRFMQACDVVEAHARQPVAAR